MVRRKSMIRCALWLVALVCLAVAVLTTGLRILLPNLNQYKPQIESAIEARTGIDVEFGQLDAEWGRFAPSLVIHDLSIDLQAQTPAKLYAKQIDVSLDLLGSLVNRQWRVSDLTLHQVAVDASQIDLLKSNASSNTAQTLRKIQNIFLSQLEHFSVIDSNLKFVSIDGMVRDLEIEQLLWQNQGRKHQAQGVLSLANANLNQVHLRAELKDGKGQDNFGGKTLTGQVYLSASDVQVTPWLTEYMQDNIGLESANVSFESWLNLENNQILTTDIAFKPSKIRWQPKTVSANGTQLPEQQLEIRKGLIRIQATPQSMTKSRSTLPDESWFGQLMSSQYWTIRGHDFDIRYLSDKAAQTEQTWPDLAWQVEGQGDNWLVNVNQLQIERLLPLAYLLPDAQTAKDVVTGVAPTGLITDLRLQLAGKALTYSLNLEDASAKQYKNAPGVNHLNASITGTEQAAQVSVSLQDSVMPFGETFLEPLNIKQAQIELEVSKLENGVELAIPKIDFSTPDLTMLGELKFDFIEGKAPFLSMYAETDLKDIGEIWRYLPAKVISPYMMNYLSTSIQQGHAKTAKVLWYGDLSEYPYRENEGIFQASIGLKDTRYAFLTTWPAIEDAQLDLLFINDALYFNSQHAKTMNVTATDLTAVIPHLNGQGHIELEAKLEGEGQDVRRYMAASPLVKTVGAALNTVQVDGKVTAGLKLNIPFNKKEALVSGYADLNKNPIHVTKPNLNFSDVTGRIEFVNDVVSTKALKATWLNQAVAIEFEGKKTSKGYLVNLNNKSDWSLAKLHQTLPDPWLGQLKG
ncbi:MAG: YhdP family protein, partial [Vibrio sp.]